MLGPENNSSYVRVLRSATHREIYFLTSYSANSGGKFSCTFSVVKSLWIIFQNLSKRRRYVAAASLNGKVYIIGGYDGQSRLSLVECLDLSQDDPQWQSVACMSQRRGLAGVTVYKGG